MSRYTNQKFYFRAIGDRTSDLGCAPLPPSLEQPLVVPIIFRIIAHYCVEVIYVVLDIILQYMIAN